MQMRHRRHLSLFCRYAQAMNSHRKLNDFTNLDIISLNTLGENDNFVIQTSLRCIVFGHGILLPSFSSLTQVNINL